MGMHNYEELEVWKVSYALARELYRDVRSFPVEERYGLVQQIRRSATSVPANIAEGSRRGTNGEFRHFLGIASGSNGETDVFLRFAVDFGYMTPEVGKQRRATNDRIHRMLTGLILSLGPRPRRSKPTKPKRSKE